jgi:polyisoprenoid-binding protein YceI
MILFAAEEFGKPSWNRAIGIVKERSQMRSASKRMMRRSVVYSGILLLLGSLAAAQARPVDTARSSITVRAYKSGLFSFAAHDHEISAPVASGAVTEAGVLRVQLAVDARQVKVLDPKASAGDRAEIQRTMLSDKVLDAEAHPQISFVSTEVQPAGAGRWKVTGNLTLHGQTHPVTMEVTGGSGSYSGACTVQQSVFGITPVSVAGGTVKVKDAVRVEFHIVLQ